PASRLLDRMRASPQSDWTIADVERMCRELGLTVTPPRRGSHYKVRDPGSGTTLTIPARRPIKAVYIRALVALADRFREEKDGA
ncbi:MAG TPA: type II toxin-antitoxin system HicA family toxin, partial [Stellaceae bacterium]